MSIQDAVENGFPELGYQLNQELTEEQRPQKETKGNIDDSNR